MTDTTVVWRLKVVLQGTRPAVWRRFDTSSNITLVQLHYFIQGVMGWELAHLFSFHDNLGRFEISQEAVLAHVCRPGDSLLYTYDFGDNWEHRITVEKEMKMLTSVSYPRCVAGGSACPPEDCGGPWGFADLLKTLAGPRKARRRELKDWLGGPFDPKIFDLNEANERLAEYVQVSVPAPVAESVSSPR